MSLSDVGTGPAYKQPSSATKQNTSSSNKTSITQKKDNLKFTDMKISVSSNSQGAKYSKSCKVTRGDPAKEEEGTIPGIFEIWPLQGSKDGKARGEEDGYSSP